VKTCTKCKAEKPKTEFHKSKVYKDGLCYRCKSCVAATSKEWYENNKEYALEKCRIRYSENPSRHQKLTSAWKIDNASRVSEKSREYYRANTEKCLANNKAWRNANPDVCATHRRKRRSSIMKAEGNHCIADVIKILESQRGLCATCGSKLFKSGKKKYHVDHIMPLSKGGSNWPSNLQCLCRDCNLRKGAKHPDDWAKENGRLL